MNTYIHMKVLKNMEDGRFAMNWAEETHIDMPLVEKQGDVEVVTEWTTHVVRGFSHFVMFKPLEVKLNMAQWTNRNKGEKNKGEKPDLLCGITIPHFIPKQCLLMLMENLSELTNGREMVITCSDLAEPKIDFIGTGTVDKPDWELKLEAIKQGAVPYTETEYGKGSPSSKSKSIDPVLSKEQLRKKMREASNQ